MRPVVLVTGASSGIGAETAAHLVRAGFHVFGTSRRPQSDDGDIEWVAMDVCDDASVDAGVAAVLERAGRIDALVCNAGIGIFGSVEDVTIEDAKAQFETNFFGVLRVLRAALPTMRTGGGGRILLVGSLAGRAPIPFQSHYSASKAAIDALAGSLANEVGSLGIHVALIEPGNINTPFNEAMAWSTSPEDSAYKEALDICEASIRAQLPKAPPPADVARCIVEALTTTRPRVRYPVGESSILVPLGKRLFPDWLNLRLIRNYFGL